MNITRFKINKLHNALSFDIEFVKNTIVLLGENGSCKTTILKILFYILSRQWEKLNQYDFNSIELEIDELKLSQNSGL